MSRDKQIEEMAKVICKPTTNKGNCDKCGFKKQCSKFDDATDLYNAGYRKATEIFEEIERLCECYKYFCEGTYAPELKDAIADLKKKYESEGADDE